MTSVVTPHDHGALGWRGAVFVRGKWRCSECGHRLTVNGVPPVESRRLPPWTWPVEFLDRYRAITPY